MSQNDTTPIVLHTSASAASLYRTLEELQRFVLGTEVGDRIQFALAQYRESQADAELIARAKELHQNDDCEIDAGALTSEADNGIWVQAWVWVPNNDRATTQD